MKNKFNTLSVIFFCFISAHLFSQDISGDWKWTYQNGKHETELTISKVGNSYVGDYCSVFFNQSKIDCYDEETNCVKLQKKSSNVYEGSFKSNFDGSTGEIRVKYLSSTKIKIELLKQPNGEYYFPKSAEFVKQ